MPSATPGQNIIIMLMGHAKDMVRTGMIGMIHLGLGEHGYQGVMVIPQTGTEIL